MVYLDPPYAYCKDGDSIGKKHISEAGYNNFYYKQDDINLYNYALKLNKNGHSFMLSGVLEHDGNVSWILDKLIQYGFKYKRVNI